MTSPLTENSFTSATNGQIILEFYSDGLTINIRGFNMIRTLGKKAFYKEREYEFLDESDGTYAIYSESSKDMEKGFKKIGTNRYRKTVKLEELDYVFEKNTVVIYNGDEFIGSIIDKNKIMLYTRDTLLGKKHNMIMRDKDEYYLYVDLRSVDEIIQKWIPKKEYMP